MSVGNIFSPTPAEIYNAALICALLTVDPSQRMVLADVYQHPWCMRYDCIRLVHQASLTTRMRHVYTDLVNLHSRESVLWQTSSRTRCGERETCNTPPLPLHLIRESDRDTAQTLFDSWCPAREWKTMAIRLCFRRHTTRNSRNLCCSLLAAFLFYAVVFIIDVVTHTHTHTHTNSLKRNREVATPPILRGFTPPLVPRFWHRSSKRAWRA